MEHSVKAFHEFMSLASDHKYGEHSSVEYLSLFSDRLIEQAADMLTLISGLSQPCVLSIGSYPGFTPFVLKQHAVDVTVLEHPSVADEAYIGQLHEWGIETIPYDVSAFPCDYQLQQSFDLIECCYCLEHWNFNPLPFFDDIIRYRLREHGVLYVAVPSAVSLYRRVTMLFGHPPVPSMDFFVSCMDPSMNSDVSAHWREYTRGDLHRLIDFCGGEVIHSRMRTYPRSDHSPALHALYLLCHNLFPGLREDIVVTAKQSATVESINE